MSHEPALSFVVPAFNAADWIDDTVGSILSQRLDVDYEIVVIDDCSADSTRQRLEALTAREPERVRTWSNARNLGGSATRNRAIALARAPLLYMVDADNLLVAGHVQPLLTALTEARLQAASVAELALFDTDPGHPIRVQPVAQRDGRSTLAELFAFSWVPAAHGNYAFSRRLFDAAGGYDESAGAMDTWTFGMKHLARGYDLAVVPGTRYLHRVGHDSYWIREERLGTNDRHAIEAVKREGRHLPSDVRTKIEALDPADPFFEYVERGSFRPGARLPNSLARRWSRLARRTRRALSSTRPRADSEPC